MATARSNGELMALRENLAETLLPKTYSIASKIGQPPVTTTALQTTANMTSNDPHMDVAFGDFMRSQAEVARILVMNSQYRIR